MMEDKPDWDLTLHSFAVLRNLDRLWKERQHCDLIIKAEEQELHVHKSVFAAGSDYFDAMLKHENIESCSGIVEMKEMKFTILEACIEYIYTGKISINETNYKDLLHAASILQLKVILSKIEHFLRSMLNTTSFFQIRKLANQFSLVELERVIDEFALCKLELIAKEANFNQLEQEYVSFLISSKVYLPEQEDVKFAIVLRWIKADIDRHKYLPKMLDAINVDNLSQAYGRYLAENEPICYESAECMRKLSLAALCGISSEEKNHDSITFRHDEPANAIILFDLASGNLQSFNPESVTRKQLHSLHFRIEDFSCLCFVAVMVNGYLYVVGENRKMYCMKVSDDTATWIEVSSMINYHGKYLRAVVHEDEIFIAGNNSMEKYDIWKDTWTAIECQDITCDECALVLHKNAIYVLGGSCDDVELKTSNEFDIKDSSWETKEEMLLARRTAAAFSHGDVITVAGGYAGTSSIKDVEQYNDKTKTWTTLAPMLIARDEFSLCSLMGKMFAVGNYNGPIDIERYDQGENSWESVVRDESLTIVGTACVPMFNLKTE